MKCDDLADEESDQADDCSLEIITREIINVQNAQIQVMRGLLESMSYPEENDCEVTMRGQTVTASTAIIAAPTSTITAAAVPITVVEVNEKEESTVTSEDTTEVPPPTNPPTTPPTTPLMTSGDTANNGSDPAVANVASGESSSASKGNTSTRAIAVIFVFSLCLVNVGF